VVGCYRPSHRLVLAVLGDGKPRSCRRVSRAAGLSLWGLVRNIWMRGEGGGVGVRLRRF